MRELRPLFAASAIDVVDLVDAGIAETAEEDSLEAFETFEANALAKARYFHRKSGLPTVADDSGLVVDALGGRPGVHSKRWSGRSDLAAQDLDDENNRLLLRSLHGMTNRRAMYVCAAAYANATQEFVCRGEVRGAIATGARGMNGFGYDPFFVADELGRSFGEAEMAEKERISHRGRAFRALIARLAGVAASSSGS